MLVQTNLSKPRRVIRPLLALPVDLTITPPATSYNPSPVAGSIVAGEMLFMSSNHKASSLATLGALATTTLGAAITVAGFQHVNLSQIAGIIPGMYLTIDTSASQEVVLVVNVDPSGIQADFTKTHSSGASVTCTVANSVSLIGVSNDNYPIVFTDGVQGSPIPSNDNTLPRVQIMEDGDHLFNTTNGDSYNPYDVLYLGADGRTVTKVANGAPIGYVSPDQRQTLGLSSQLIAFPISGGSGVPIYAHILPVLAK